MAWGHSRSYNVDNIWLYVRYVLCGNDDVIEWLQTLGDNIGNSFAYYIEVSNYLQIGYGCYALVVGLNPSISEPCSIELILKPFSSTIL